MGASKRSTLLQPILDGVQGWLEIALALLERLDKLNILLFIASIALFSFLILGKYGRFFGNPSLRLALFLVFILVGGVLLRAAGFQKSWGELLIVALLLIAFGYKIATYSTDISTYPFSLGWSEGSRYYYASLFFSERIYGTSAPLPVLHPSQYLTQSVPFLLQNSQIWLLRLWEAILWIGTTFTTAYLLARRLSITDRLRRWAFIAWSFLFLLLGPVFYHLQIPVILVLLLFDKRKPWRSLLVVLLASAWTGISRVNWFPVPGMLATTLYFLEKPVERLSLWQYLTKPVLWIGLGTMTAFISQTLYIVWSGNPPELFASSFTSDLLWYRLLPNPTYRLGVLPAALLASSPLYLLIADRLVKEWKSYHLVRLLGMGSILFILFTGGLLVSTKIGGGNNLHNLDAYFVLLLVITAYIFFGDIVTEQPGDQNTRRAGWATTVGLIIALLLPVYIIINSGTPTKPFDRAETERALKRINRFARVARKKGGEVLFIDERQLLTFQDVENTKLVPDYEKVFLIEMAMGGNDAYLDRFHEDLKTHRFALIVSEPLFIQYKGSAEPFGEENDAWVKHVSEPLLCYYKPTVFLPEVQLRLYEPRANPRECP